MKLLQTIPVFPSLTLAHKNGVLKYTDLKQGQVVVFYFWSRDCSLCKRWPQFVEKLQQLYGDSVQCIVVHDGDIELNEVPNVSTVISTIDRERAVASAFNVRQYPAIYVFDREHQLRFYQSGSSETRMLLRRIEKFIDLF